MHCQYNCIVGTAAEKDGHYVQAVQRGLTTDNLWPIEASSNHFLPPTITRLLLPTYQYYPGEQLHFLVEYAPTSEESHCDWQVQYSSDQKPRAIEDGFVVNADCSSILIIESITSKLQGIYTFFVENMYGRATTQTTVIVNTDNDDDVIHGN